jgi:hypothetical protein
LFGAAQLDMTIEDRFGHPVKPREWFLVPLHVIDEAVQRIRDGSITDVVYDPETARMASVATAIREDIKEFRNKKALQPK